MTDFDNGRRLAVLVGNGLSIAFNYDLNLQSITEEVLRRIERADGGDVVAAMKEIAERTLPDGATSAEDFEMLVGAFGAESRTLDLLRTLAELQDPADRKLRKAIKRVTRFAEQVRDAGISHVLEVIAERSHAYVDDAQDLHELVEAVTNSFDGRVVFGNLNYDTLLLAALLWTCKSELADMGHGYRSHRVTLGEGESRVAPALRRRRSDFPSEKRIQLLHLHGSITFWGTRDRRACVKLPRELVELEEPWRAMRERSTDIRPLVVLANQRDKADSVGQFPYDLAYSMFADGVQDADDWLIIGYSFRDRPINELLRTEFLDRKRPPRVLVVTHGELPTRRTVERALGWGIDDGSSRRWLTINRAGANGLQDHEDWAAFTETS